MTLSQKMLFAALLSVSAMSIAQEISIYSGTAPGSEGWTIPESANTDPKTGNVLAYRNVSKPTLTLFKPDSAKANGTAMIVVPGGGWRAIGFAGEGTNVAKWLADRGIMAMVLKYRVAQIADTPQPGRGGLPPAPPAGTIPNADIEVGPYCGGGDPKFMGMAARPYACEDLRQAMKVVRQHAHEWGINPNRVGVIGFSAGAFATMGLVSQHDQQSRPDFVAVIYGGSDDKMPLPSDAPPAFFAAASDDQLIAPINTTKNYEKWYAAKIPAEMHIFSRGGHAFGLSTKNLPVDHWIDLFGSWLEVQGLMKK